jgi:phosphopantothenoylcysteine decarboxylase/phosphopantothenate--cysteine ligase
VETLRGRGIEIVGPDEGDTAEGEWGVGRMVEPQEIFAAVERALRPGDLAGLRVVVSAGGTREAIDAVRFIGNRASGRMGVALAAEARRRGADVTLLAANLAVDPPGGVESVQTPTVDDMLREALARADADVIVMAAAPADYRPVEQLPDKRQKDDESWTLELGPTTDILRTLGEQKRPGQVLVGFAADHGEAGVERAREKLNRKHADLIVYNDVSRTDIGFDSPENEVTFVTRDGERTIAKAPKAEIAKAILDAAAEFIGERERAAGV